MWKPKYKKKLTVVTALMTACFMILTGMTLSKIGITPMSHEDYEGSRENILKIKTDKAYYQKVMGDIYDTNGYPIFVTDTIIEKASIQYHPAYSNLLGNPHIADYGLISRYFDTLTDDSAEDTIKHKGYSMQLTLDDELQQYAYSMTEGTRASIVVLKRHSGELLAMTSTYTEPFALGCDLDETTLEKYNNANEPIWRNEALHAYAPGSCQKIVTAAMGYETGLDDYTIDDIGYVEYDGEKIYNNEEEEYGEGLDMETAFTVSSNTYFASLMNEIDKNSVHRLCLDLRLDYSFDTDFGSFTNYFSYGWRSGDSSRFSRGLLGIGQRSELSAVGMAMVTQTVIDNELYLPHIVKNTCYVDKNGYLQVADVTKEELIDSGMLKNDTSAKVRSLMETAAHSSGYQLSDDILGAKSGTADIDINNEKTNRASLVAYDDNYIVVVSKIEAGAYGISNKNIMENIFDYLASNTER